MRIVYLHQYFNTAQMIGSTRSYELARRLVAFGHEVHVVTSWREQAEAKSWFTTFEQGITIHWLPVGYSNAMTYPRRILAFVKFAVLAARRASELPCDVVFATSTPLTIAVPGAYAARRHRKPMVFEVRDLWPELPIALGALRDPVSRWLAQALERFAYRSAERIVALSPGMKRGVASTGYPAERISVIPNFADLECFEFDQVKGQAFRDRHPELGSAEIVLYAGTLGKIHAVSYAVELAAASKATHPDRRFVVIGDGAERQAIMELAEKKQVLQSNFFMYSPLPKEEMAGPLSAASIALSLCMELPELEANSANKFFEGLASGTPMAINYGGWQAELLEEVGAGLRLSRDPHVAAKQLHAFLDNRDGVARAGVQARQTAEERFSCDALAKSLERVLSDASDDYNSRQ